jgi:uncharacterized integral membrane protein
MKGIVRMTAGFVLVLLAGSSMDAPLLQIVLSAVIGGVLLASGIKAYKESERCR